MSNQQPHIPPTTTDETTRDREPWGAIVGGVLIAASFFLTLSQDGKPLIMFSEEVVMLGAACAIAAIVAPFIGPKQKVVTIVVVGLAAAALTLAVVEIAAYEQAVSELQREMQNW